MDQNFLFKDGSFLINEFIKSVPKQFYNLSDVYFYSILVNFSNSVFTVYDVSTV